MNFRTEVRGFQTGFSFLKRHFVIILAHRYACGRIEHGSTRRDSSMTARGEVTGRKISPDAVDDADAFSIGEFCRRNRISIQLFYKLKKVGMMPATFRLGARVLISKEAAAAWRREREAAAQS
jgi:hypothetical protein